MVPKEFAKIIEQWFTRFNVNKDMYDSAIDSVYNTTHIGGAKLHHLVDGQHTLWGAFEAAKNTHADDSFFQEVTNSAEHLVRDLCSKSGINPFLKLTKEQIDKTASFTHIPKSWLADALTINATELIGATMGAFPIIFCWTKLESKQFANYAGALCVPAIISANPLLGLIVIIAAARAFTTAKSGIKEKKLVLAKCALKGMVVPSIVISLSIVIGGPVYIGLILGIIVAIFAKKKLDDKKFSKEFRVSLRKFSINFIKPQARFIGNFIKNMFTKIYKKAGTSVG